MTYLLRKAVLARHPTLPLSVEEHTALRSAWAGIFTLVQIEETWDSVIQNYLELEQSWLAAALRSSVLRPESYDEMHDLRLGFARRLSNLLTTVRAYLDQTPQRLGELGDEADAEVFKTLCRQAHARDFGYRLMEGLRNYAQHHGQSLHGVTFGSNWTGDPDDASRRLLFSVSATIDVTALLGDPEHLNKNLAEELSRDLSGKDAPTMVRIYLEGLGSVQAGIRDQLKDRTTAWTAAIAAAVARYGAVNDGNVVGLELVEFADSGSEVSSMSLFMDMPDRLQQLIRRNGSLINLRKRVVTNGLRGEGS